ncbi:MAG: Hsp20/alpha crystallin family protein [Candidatus Dormibacterales bacterium]
MMLAPWNPLPEFAAMERTLDHLFSEVSGAPTGQAAEEPSFYRLAVNVETVEDGYLISAPMPGFKPEEVEISLSDGLLTISGRRREDRTTGTGAYVRREVRSGNLYRQIVVGREVGPDSVKADFEDGVLKVRILESRKPEPQKIPVGAGTSQVLDAGSAPAGDEAQAPGA